MRAMRTTLTIDDDLAQALKAMSGEQRASFKAVVNQVLRRGLTAGDEPVPAPEPFRVAAKRRGFRAGVDPLKLNQLVDELETDHFLAQDHGTRAPG